jgi:tripartite-type tricarboxylate transporter receptor subunit TctC
LGQAVIVENRANNVIGEYVAKSPPDGYNLFVAGGAVWTLTLLRKMNYDMTTDFAPISLLVRSVGIVAVHPSVPAKSIKELIGLAKARPGALNYGSTGAGSGQQLRTELFKSMAGVDIVHVPYKGSGQVISALLSGELQMWINDSGVIAPYAKSGKLRALAVTSAQPSALTPGLPTVSASGLPGYEAVSISGIFAPAKTPPAIISRLNQEIIRFLNQPEAKERFLNAQEEIVASSPQQLGNAVKAELAQWAKVIKDANISAD